MSLTVMRVTVNEVSSHLCKMLTLIIVKTYMQRQRHYCIALWSVVTCYNSAKAPETSKSIHKRSETHSFFAGRTSRNDLYNWDNANFSAWAPLLFSSNVFQVKMIMHDIFRIKRIHTFYKKLRSGPNTESFLASGDFEYSKFLNSFLTIFLK